MPGKAPPLECFMVFPAGRPCSPRALRFCIKNYVARRLTRKLIRLSQASCSEARCRLAQAARERIERIWPASRLRRLTDKQLRGAITLKNFQSLSHADAAGTFFEHLRTRRTPRFFAGVGATSEGRKSIVARAERVLDGEFDLLAYRRLRFDDPDGGLRWDYDPVNGIEAPQTFWADVPYLDPAVVGDSKVVWELSRFQFVFDLAKAYACTDDDRYSEAYFRLFHDWCRKNPPGIGVNWCSSLELALRSVSWIWGHHFFLESPAYDADTAWKLVKSLVIHARRIAAYLSYYFAPNTHLLGEALGLFYIGLFLPELREAEAWRRLGMKILIDESEKQIRPDGGYFEQSTYYHRYALDFYQQLVILCNRNGITLPGDFRARIEKMTEFVLYAMLPDGRLPMIGDADAGKALQLERCDTNDARAALSTGAVLFNRGDFKWSAGCLHEETRWLLGPEGADVFAAIEATPPQRTSVHFPDTGWFFLRSGWSKDANYLYFDCGPQGMGPSGHGHADMLGIEVAGGGRPIIIDPGTYIYTPSVKWRDYFRGTGAHNTATVDGSDQAIPAEPFKWEQLPRCELISSHLGEGLDYIDARHTGYERLNDPVLHRRRVLFIKPEYWLIVDTFEAAGEHDYEITFNLAPSNVVMQPVGLATATKDTDKPNCLILPACANHFEGDIMAGGTDPIRGWVSYDYGGRLPCPSVRYRLRGAGCRQTAFVIYPLAAGAQAHVAARLLDCEAPADGYAGAAALAVEITIGNTRDYVAPSGRADGLITFKDVRIKAEAAWIRTDRADAPSEFRIVNGTQLCWGDRELFRSGALLAEVSQVVSK